MHHVGAGAFREMVHDNEYVFISRVALQYRAQNIYVNSLKWASYNILQYISYTFTIGIFAKVIHFSAQISDVVEIIYPVDSLIYLLQYFLYAMISYRGFTIQYLWYEL